jgi:hypothetical protein
MPNLNIILQFKINDKGDWERNSHIIFKKIFLSSKDYGS